jgi:hypothetical protein
MGLRTQEECHHLQVLVLQVQVVLDRCRKSNCKQHWLKHTSKSPS